MRLFLGVDGGQSGTLALIGDESGRVLGAGRAGPCNHAALAEGRAKFEAAIGGSVRGALEHAGVSGVFESACFGFSGGPSDKEALTRELVQSRQYLITHDAWIALAGATAGEPGAIAIAGTGSIAFGRNAAGRSARAGGWGFVFGDEGSAFDLVRQALRAMLRHEEGWGAPTALTDLLLAATSASSANELLHRFYTTEFPRDRVAALAPIVDSAAIAGDPAAQEILKSAAQSLAALLATVRGRLFEPSAPVLASFTGGVFQSRILLERFRLLTELDGVTSLAAPRYSPAAGALIEAWRAARLNSLPREIPGEKGALL
jgi:N-acetylglucosamine kinase